MIQKKSITLLMCVVSLGSQAFAARETAAPSAQPTVANPNPTVQKTPLPTAPSADSLKVPAYQSTSNSASMLQGIGQVVGMASSAIYAQQGAAAAAQPNPPLAAFWFLGSALSAAQAGGFGSASKQSAAARAGVTVGTGTQYGAGTDSKVVEQYKRQVEGILESARSQGYQINLSNNTITDPNGNTYSASDFSSRASMQKKGLSASTIAGIEKGKAEISQKISAMAKKELSKAKSGNSAGTDSGSYGEGGGGSKIGASGGGSYSASAFGLGMPGANAGLAAGAARDPAQVAGMTRDYHGTPIGVSAENLFLMMNRRYDLHTNNGSLLPNN